MMRLHSALYVFSYGCLAVILLACLPVFLEHTSDAQTTKTRTDSDPDLQSLIDSATRGFRGDAGVYIEHLVSGRSAGRNEDALFPSASLIKVAIMATVFDRIDQGMLSLDDRYPFRDTLRTAGAGILAGFRNDEPVSIEEMLNLMISASDNTAALWLQQLSGSGNAVNDWLQKHGFEQTRVNAGTPGRKRQWKQFNWGQTTPREIARLFVEIRNGTVGSSESNAKMYRMLGRSFYDEEGISSIPPSVLVLSKQASVERSRSEVLLVHAPNGDYVIVVMTKNIRDISWDRDNEAFELIRQLSTLVWKYFESDSADGGDSDK